MSFQERRAIVYATSSILISVLYATYMAPSYPEGGVQSADIFRWWGHFFLLLIGVSIVAKIIIHILFSILNTIATREEEPKFLDERDQLIEAKSARIALYLFAVGFMLAIASLVVINEQPSTMFAILFMAGIVTDVVSELAQFYFYRRGF